MKTMIGSSRKSASLRRLAFCVVPLVIATAVGGQSIDGGEYTPARVAPRAGAGYVLPDGTIQIVTCSRLTGVVRALDGLFAATHPGIRFKVLEGDNYSAMAALTFDRTAFAPLGSEYTRIGLGDNLKIASEPIGFRIAHASLSPGLGVPELGVIVNVNNPIESISTAQLTRIFAVGAPVGDIATWSQAGVAGPIGEREVHPVGPMPSDYTDSEDAQAGEFLSNDKMSGLNMNHRYVALPSYAGVVERVKEDPAAIGITALNIPLGDVRVIGLKSEGGPVSRPSAAEIEAGRYPLDRFVYIYLRVGRGLPLDTFAKEYMRLVLSDEGQRVIAREASGYIPLNTGELAEERARLDQ